MEKSYSASERALARLLSKFPFIKQKAKYFYQYFNYLLFNKKDEYVTSYKIRGLENGDKEYFFGYYDKSPINISKKFLIVHECDGIKTKSIPGVESQINICLFNFSTISKKISFKVNSFNWQQGSRLQWINDSEFIYNNYDKDKGLFYSVIYNVETLEDRRIDFPIYDVHKENFSISLNFDRLSAYSPEYGYRCKEELDLGLSSNDGIYYIDLLKNERDLLLSFDDICNCSYLDVFANSSHTVNHIMLSPNGNKFIFIHRYYVGKQRFDRLLSYEISTKVLKVLADNTMVSHCTWKDDNAIVGYLRGKSGEDSYYEVCTVTGNQKVIAIPNIAFKGDGHPTVKNGSMLYDTYPNKARMKQLYLFKDNIDNLIGEFVEPMAYYGETRCDLHPRFSYCGEYVFFDSVHNGKRNLYWLKL